MTKRTLQIIYVSLLLAMGISLVLHIILLQPEPLESTRSQAYMLAPSKVFEKNALLIQINHLQQQNITLEINDNENKSYLIEHDPDFIYLLAMNNGSNYMNIKLYSYDTSFLYQSITIEIVPIRG